MLFYTLELDISNIILPLRLLLIVFSIEESGRSRFYRVSKLNRVFFFSKIASHVDRNKYFVRTENRETPQLIYYSQICIFALFKHNRGPILGNSISL